MKALFLLVLGLLLSTIAIWWKKAQIENEKAGRAYLTNYVNKYARNYVGTPHANLFTEETRKELGL